MNQQPDEPISISDEFQMTSPRSRRGFPVDRVEWERLKRRIKNSPVPIRWTEAVVGLCGGASFSFIGFALSLPSHSTAFYTAALSSFVVGATFVFFAFRDKRRASYEKEEIIKFMEEMEGEEFTSAANKAKVSEESWVASTKTQNRQWVDYKELPLKGRLLHSLNFSVSSSSQYWRAGFKLVAPNAPESMPKLLTDKSFLLHVGRKEGDGFILSIYHDGNTGTATHKTLDVQEGEEITISIERNENNFVSCFINGSLEYNKRFNPELFKKVYLAAWGDDHEYEVTFNNISYEA